MSGPGSGLDRFSLTHLACHPVTNIWSRAYGLGCDRSLQFHLSKVSGSRSFSDLKTLTGSRPIKDQCHKPSLCPAYVLEY